MYPRGSQYDPVVSDYLPKNAVLGGELASLFIPSL